MPRIAKPRKWKNKYFVTEAGGKMHILCRIRDGMSKARKELSKYLAQLEQEREQGDNQAHVPRTVAECAAEFLALKRTTKSKRTFESYSGYLQRLLKWYGQLDVNQVTLSHGNDYLGKLSELKLGPVSVNHHTQAARAVFNYAVDCKWIANNPWRRLPKLPEVGRRRIVTDEEFGKLLTACYGCRAHGEMTSDESTALMKDILRVLRFTALRPGELRKLRWEHLLLDENLIVIPANEHKTGTTTSDPKDRVVPFLDDAKVIFERRRLKYGHHPRVFSNPTKSRAFWTVVFRVGGVTPWWTQMNNDQSRNDLRDVQPTSFSHVIGQKHVTEALKIAVDASFQEGKRLDEILLCGPPGLGKSALVSVLAEELAVPFTEILAQSLTNAAELNTVLLSAAKGILFLDEIHLLHPVQQHALLQVLDKRRIFLSGGKALQSIPVADFTLIGATTDPDGLIGPLIDRFRMVLHLDYYSDDELGKVVQQRCRAMGWEFEPELLAEIAMRAKGTPRLALRLLQSARRCSVAEGSASIEVRHLTKACCIERVSSLGLDNLQQKYIALLKDGPLRLNVLSSALGMSTKVLVKTVEPYLIRAGFVLKDDCGRRQLSEKAREHLSESRPETD